jgi:subtilisin
MKNNNRENFSVPLIEPEDTAEDLKELQSKSAQEKEKIAWGQYIIGLPDVWRQTQGEHVKVAILDTGVDSDHPDLNGAVMNVRNFTGGTDDDVEDGNGHGTHCAGIVAARINDVGFIGVAPKAELVVGKVLDDQGRGSNEEIAEGVEWAVTEKADIISMSLGGPFPSSRLYKAIYSALAQGVHVVCAAGNAGSLFGNSIGYPGRWGGVITVAAHDRLGNRAGFSSRGGEIDVMAPGSEIWSTYKNGQYARLSGTSMATPFVAGLAALIVSKHKKTTDNATPINNNEDLKNHLLKMASHPGYYDNERGYGTLQPFLYFGMNAEPWNAEEVKRLM